MSTNKPLPRTHRIFGICQYGLLVVGFFSTILWNNMLLGLLVLCMGLLCIVTTAYQSWEKLGS